MHNLHIINNVNKVVKKNLWRKKSFQMQFRQLMIFFFFIFEFSYLTLSKKEFYKILSTFI